MYKVKNPLNALIEVEKTCFPTDELIYYVRMRHNHWRCVIKSYDKLKVEM